MPSFRHGDIQGSAELQFHDLSSRTSAWIAGSSPAMTTCFVFAGAETCLNSPAAE
jgi:hypothetical protein